MSYNEEESSGNDSDTGFDEDMEALRKACSITGVGDSVDDIAKLSADYGDTYASEDEDIELLRSIQQRFSVSTNDIDREHISMKPLNIILPSGLSDDNDDYGDDFETLRAIQRRFSQYHDNKNNKKESPVQKSAQVGATNIDSEKESSPNFFVKRFNNGQGFPDCVDGSNTNQNLELSGNNTPEPGSEIIQVPDCGFPRSAQAFVEAIKKNRICQKFIRNKLGQIEAKMEENKKLRERVKILKDFQVACRKKTGRALSQKKDPRIQLISVLKQRSNAAKDKENHAINQGPAENSDVADYRDAMSKYSFALTREPWSDEEKENLLKGIKQQFQKMLLQNYLSGEDANCDLESMILKIKDHEISPEEMRSFLPKVNWEDLASMYVTGRSGPECRSRWMNWEDPLINHEPWGLPEDKKLLYIVQNKGLSNWIEIGESVRTNRTPFQCLSRFQRSLNASIIKNEWTPPEDEELRNAVAEYGDSNWQIVASTIEGRTGPQCSNRWNKSLNPMRKKVGKWKPDEDKHLKIAVKLFGAKNWYKIARYVPGRTQVQIRERWVNCLDPALNMKEWTEEEDEKLKNAIEEYGYSWSKIAACVPPRTDSQCRRRWKVVLPHEVPMLQKARKMKKAAFITNFVDREAQRPALTVNDFVAPLLIESAPEKRRRNQRSVPEQCEPESSSGAVVRARKVTHTEKTLQLMDEEDLKGNQRSKKKQNMSTSQETEEDVNNHHGAIDVENSQTKKKATRKRKQRGSNTEEDETFVTSLKKKKTTRPPMNNNIRESTTESQETLLNNNSNIKTKPRKPRGNKEKKRRPRSINIITESEAHDDDQMCEAGVIDLSASTESPKNNPNSLSDLNNCQGTTVLLDGKATAKQNGNRKPRRVNKEDEKTKETLKQKTTRRPRWTVGVMDLSSSPSAIQPPVEKDREINTTLQKCKVSRKKGGNHNIQDTHKASVVMTQGIGEGRSSGEIGDEETIGSFFTKLKKRTTPDEEEETLGSFFMKLKKRTPEEEESIASYFNKLKKTRLE